MFIFKTSYFANLPKTDSEDYVHMSVSRFTPDFFKQLVMEKVNYMNAPALSPSKELLSDIKEGRCTRDEYAKRYATEILTFMRDKQHMALDEYFDAVEDKFKEKYKGLIFTAMKNLAISVIGTFYQN